MRRRKREIVALLLCSCMLVLAACGKVAGTDTKEKREDQVQIGITFDTFVLERWLKDRDVFVSAAEELGAKVNVQNANGDIDEQIKQIDYFIEKKMDVIVIVQVADEEKTLKGAVARAHDAGIKVVAYDRLILNADVDLYISFDNERVGELMANHICAHSPKGGTIMQICGPLSDNNVSMVLKGFNETIAKNNFTILETDYCKGWVSELAFDYASTFLSKNQTPTAIMCGNDALAGNAIRALSETQLAGKVCVVGQDADLDACQRIVEGTQCMTVYKPIEKLARRAAELSVAMGSGKQILSVVNTINDGSYDVQFEKITPIAVTKENMDEVITGKYHEESDIYRNVRKGTQENSTE